MSTTTNIYLRGNKKRPRLRVQLFQGFVLIAALPIVIFSLANSFSRTREHQRSNSQRLKQAAGSITQGVEHHLVEHQQAIVSLAAALELDANLTTPRLNQWLAEFHQIYDGFITMLVIDSQGRPIAAQPVKTLDGSAFALDTLPSVSDREYFRFPMATAKPFISDVFLGRGFGADPIVAISAPILGQDGRPVGVVEGSLHLGQLKHFAQSYVDPGEVQQPTIITDHLDRVLFATQGFSFEVLESLRGSPLLKARNVAKAGELLHYEVEDGEVEDGEVEDGRSFIAFRAVAQPHGWQIFTVQSLTEIRQAIRRDYLISALWGLVAVGLSILLARLLASNVVRPLELMVERVRGLAIDGVELDELPEVDNSAPREVAQLMGQIEDMAIGLDLQVRERTADLAEKNKELERFAYTVSHDLKSPLVTLEGFMGFLIRDVADGNTERIEQDITMLKGTVDKMNLLVVGLLELSRIGHESFSPVLMNLADAAHEAAQLLAGRIAKENIDLQIQLGESPVQGDPTLLRMVFQNLIENATKFSDSPQAQIMIGARDKADQSASGKIFFVQDHGIGINLLHQEKIFGVFERLNPDQSGTGIGLASVKRVVELHGGRIWVESKGEGHGSTFCFTLGEG